MAESILWEGNVRNRSLHERVEVARQLGCRKMSLSPNTLAQWEASGIPLEAVKEVCGEVQLSHLDPLVRWTRGYRDANLSPQLREFSATSRADFFACAERLGVASITLPAIVNAEDTTEDELASDFGDVCDEARELGIRCDLEFLPYWSGVPDLEAAVRVVELAGRDNGRVLFDAYHFVRGYGSPDQILAVDGRLISAIQISDGVSILPDGTDGVDDMLNARRLPGHGSFPLHQIVGNLAEIGAGDIVGVEVFSTDLDALSNDEVVAALELADSAYLTAFVGRSTS